MNKYLEGECMLQNASEGSIKNEKVKNNSSQLNMPSTSAAIKSTKDYAKFILVPVNRPVRKPCKETDKGYQEK